MKFPSIDINGVSLTLGQAMTIHTAIQNFAQSLQDENALGDDKFGKIMRLDYLNRIKEINNIYIQY